MTPGDGRKAGGSTMNQATRRASVVVIFAALLCTGCSTTSPKNKDLTDAAWQGNANRVKLLLDEGVSVDARSPHNNTALMNAARQGHTEVARLLLARGANVNAVGNNNWSALHNATWGGHTQIVRLLLDGGADTRIRARGATVDLNFKNGATALDLMRIGGGNREIEALLERASGQVGLYGEPKYDSPMNGKVGLPFSKHPGAPCRGGHWSANVNLNTGALPPGLRFSGTSIEGVPERAGTWHFSVRFSNFTCAGKSYPDVTQTVTIVTEGSAAPRRVD